MTPLKIIIPEGTEAEIDHENRVVVFNPIKKEVKVESLPKSVGLVKGRQWHIGNDAGIYKDTALYVSEYNNRLSSKPRAEAFLALMQLVELRDAWNGEWRADWKDGSYKSVIVMHENRINIYSDQDTQHVLNFRNTELGLKFRDQFKDLIEQAKELL